MNKSEIFEELRERWRSLLQSLSVDGELAAVLFADLVARYDEEGRYYHDLSHVRNVLSVVDNLGDMAQDLTAVRLAAWYHDVIYDVRETDNEVKSAEFAGRALTQMGMDQSRSTAIQRMIRATELSHAPPDDIDTKILLDADLATLASDPELYDENAKAIRREYAFVPESEYREARVKILDGFLRRERIFLTENMFANGEKRARENLRREIASLSG
jgi:predicted metal-dependent HD superfamily phosphohydrolase